MYETGDKSLYEVLLGGGCLSSENVQYVDGITAKHLSVYLRCVAMYISMTQCTWNL